MATKQQSSEGPQFFDPNCTTKAWKDTYLAGIETGLKLQAEAEQLAIDATKQGLAAQGQMLHLFTTWTETSFGQIPGMNEAHNPFLAWSKQYAQTVQSSVEPVVATTAKTFDDAVQSYETTFAKPFRTHVKDANKQALDTVIQD